MATSSSIMPSPSLSSDPDLSKGFRHPLSFPPDDSIPTIVTTSTASHSITVQTTSSGCHARSIACSTPFNVLCAWPVATLPRCPAKRSSPSPLVVRPILIVVRLLLIVVRPLRPNCIRTSIKQQPFKHQNYDFIRIYPGIHQCQ